MYLSALDESLRCSAHEEAFAIRNHLGWFFNQQSMIEKAIQQFELALEGYTNLWGPDHEEIIYTLEYLKICRQQLEAEKEMSNPVPEDRNSVSESRRLSAP
jgi:Tfp pilus assembly protein PilF